MTLDEVLGTLLRSAPLAIVWCGIRRPGHGAAGNRRRDEAEAAPGQTFSEELTVTARKREENLQEVPFSIVAPSEDVLRNRGVSNLEEIATNVAGFTVQNLGPGQSQVAMRGVASGQIVRDQPGVKEQVGIYLDESVISLSLFTPDIDLFDMSRVEVLRGPQGTLFGSGSLAGTVRYITNQPKVGVSEGFGEFSLNSVGDGSVGGNAKVAGARWYDYEENRSQVFDGLFADPGPTEGETSADGIAPRFIASFEVSENTRLNAQVSKGFRLGGINDPLNVPVCTPEDLETFGGRDSWKDEELWNFEVGSKSTILGGRGTFNIAAFTMDISDLQTTVTAGSCSSRLIFNVPSARSTGLEVEITGQPTGVFDYAISASYADSEIGSTLTSTAADGTTSVVSGIEKGNRLPTVPKFQATVAATYRWEAGDWAGYLTGAFQHVGSRFTQIGDHAPGFGTVDLLALSATNPIGGPLTQSVFRFNPEMPAYDLVNLRLGFLNERWDIALFINNATDERAFLALDQERGTRARVGYLTNQPRTIGVSSRINF